MEDWGKVVSSSLCFLAAMKWTAFSVMYFLPAALFWYRLKVVGQTYHGMKPPKLLTKINYFLFLIWLSWLTQTSLQQGFNGTHVYSETAPGLDSWLDKEWTCFQSWAIQLLLFLIVWDWTFRGVSYEQLVAGDESMWGSQPTSCWKRNRDRGNQHQWSREKTAPEITCFLENLLVSIFRSWD
jgi:hypothetical protein